MRLLNIPVGRASFERWRPALDFDHLPRERRAGGRTSGENGPQALGGTLGRIGQLEARLARNAREVRRAQKLRYRVFYQEMAAIPDVRARLARRDIDPFDAICDHLLVLDHADAMPALHRKPQTVGTYRLLLDTDAARHGGYYSATEFDIGGLTAIHPRLRFLELGRSCVLGPYRNKRTIELLWRGVWNYALATKVDVMFGCASFPGTDLAALAEPLAYLHHFAAAPDRWRAPALPHRRVAMDRLSKSAVDAKAAWRALPPLLRGYLRLGAFVGDGAVIDRQFGTTDVLVVLPVRGIDPRYLGHFGPAGERRLA